MEHFYPFTDKLQVAVGDLRKFSGRLGGSSCFSGADIQGESLLEFVGRMGGLKQI